MASTVPILDSLDDIYPAESLAAQQQRWNHLLAAFKDKYNAAPNYIARSPGRVNLIGEHIDYSLYPVVPMAVEQDVLIAVRMRSRSSEGSTGSRIHLSNINAERFPDHDFQLDTSGDVTIDSSALQWSNYFKAGLQGAVELLRKLDHDPLKVDLDVLATGSVPAGGGMSSSAAFVCASALAVLRAAGLEHVDRTQLVETAVVSERSVGVNSGGMDQSASVFGEKGSALRVSFVPELVARPIQFPELETPLTFVVAQSLVAADKHTSAPVCYNLRVVECTLAALVLGKITRTPLKEDKSPLGMSLRTFHDAFIAAKKGFNEETDSGEADQEEAQLQRLLRLVEDYLPQEEGYTREQISDLLGQSVQELEDKYMTKFPVRAETFKLQQRATHVFSEALRVTRFLGLLEGTKPTTAKEGEALLRDLGALLNDTQDSCRDTYECSCPELDELCTLARGAGAFGSRLTGAGWGGCSVHLVPADKVDKIRQVWTEKYYKKRFPDITEAKLAEAIVISKPGHGSCIVDVKGRDSL